MIIVQSYFTPIHTPLFAGSERMTWSCFLRLWRKKPLLWDRRKKTWKNINLNWIFCWLKNYTMSRYSDRFTPISIWCVGLLVYTAVPTYSCIGFCFLTGYFAIYNSPTCFHNSAIYPDFTIWFVPEIDSCSKKSETNKIPFLVEIGFKWDVIFLKKNQAQKGLYIFCADHTRRPLKHSKCIYNHLRVSNSLLKLKFC